MDLAMGRSIRKRRQGGVTTDKADMIFASVPYKIMHEFQMPIAKALAERDADFYKKLEKVGFMHDWGADGSGLMMKYLRRGSAITSTSARRSGRRRKIKLKSGVEVERIKKHSVLLSDGPNCPPTSSSTPPAMAR